MEKAAELNTRFDGSSNGVFSLPETRQAVAMGIEAKQGLRASFAAAAPPGSLLDGLEQVGLSRRARDHPERVETARLAYASIALAS